MKDHELARLTAICQRAKEAAEYARTVQEQRDELIRELVDEHEYTQREVAAAAGLSRSRLVAVMAGGIIDSVI